MNTTIHRANTRGYFDHGWLKTHHTFSFAGYYNPDRIQFGALRVLNDDIIEGGHGFGTHPHNNMEVISVPVYGSMKHRDSGGHEGVIGANEIQVMSAGSGIYHSEYNASETEDMNFLQIWILPKEMDIQPHYDQKKFDPEQKKNAFMNVAGPDTGTSALWINQDAYVSLASLDEGASLVYKVHNSGNGLYLFVIEGDIEVNGVKLSKRDGAGIDGIAELPIQTNDGTELLAIEVPMK